MRGSLIKHPTTCVLRESTGWSKAIETKSSKRYTTMQAWLHRMECLWSGSAEQRDKNMSTEFMGPTLCSRFASILWRVDTAPSFMAERRASSEDSSVVLATFSRASKL